MTVLRPIEMKLLDELFGMSSGYVLNFSNKTFAEFFAHELNVDIYADAYEIIGTSKGKRLQAFLQISQRPAIVKVLTALWEYREADFISSDTKDPVKAGRERLSAVIERLGGPPLPPDPTAPKPVEPAPVVNKGPSEGVLSALEQEFLAMHQMDDRAQERGYAFERFLKRWFDTWGLDARSSFRCVGEQIDGSFQHDAETYLVEAKWHNAAADAAMLHGFQGKLLERPDWTRGLYVSYMGFSAQSFDAFTARRLIMMDGGDIYLALRRRLDLGQIIAAKVRRHAERRQPFARVGELFP